MRSVGQLEVDLRIVAEDGNRPGAVHPGPDDHLFAELLQLDGAAGAFDGLLGLLGLFLGDLLEDGLRGAVDEVLGLLETEVREGAHLLDDLDLLVAGRGEDDVELVLLLLGAGVAAATTGAGRRPPRPRGPPR